MMPILWKTMFILILPASTATVTIESISLIISKLNAFYELLVVNKIIISNLSHGSGSGITTNSSHTIQGSIDQK